MKQGEMPLSGDKAYELFISSEPFPLNQFLDDWKAGKFEAASGYVIAVVNAYGYMSSRHDGPRDGTYRPKP